MPRYVRSIPRSIRVNLLDQQFGRLTVVGFGGRKKGQTIWIAQCQCGHVAEYHAGNLRAGRSSQCVNCQLEALQQTKKNRTHGYSNTPTYRAWTGTRRHGRCKRWELFEGFLADMGERPAGARLIRIDKGKPFFKSNARWQSPTDTLKEDVQRTIEAMLAAGVIDESQIPAQRRRLLEMTRQTRYQIRATLQKQSPGK